MNRNKPIILIAGELGAGCTEVGEAISKELGLMVYNTERFIRNLVSSPTLSFEVLAEKSMSGEVELEKMIGVACLKGFSIGTGRTHCSTT